MLFLSPIVFNHPLPFLANMALSRTDPNSPRVREMIRKFYDVVEFPVDFANFDDLAIYVRR